MSAKKTSIISNYTEVKVKDEEGNEKPKKVAITKDHRGLIFPTSHFIAYKEEEGKTYLLDAGDPRSIIDGSDGYYAKLFVKGFTIDFRRMPGAITLSQHMRVTASKAKTVNRFSILPELVSDDKTEYLTDANFRPYKPKNTGAFKELLSLYTLETEEYRHRLAAGVLSGFMPRAFDGKRPMTIVLANTKSSGKTTMVRSLIDIVQGESGIELVGDDSDESQHGGIGNMAKRYAIYDNLQYMTEKEFLKITRGVTDSIVKSWTFGRSHARVPNNKAYFATFNSDESVNNDILNRVISVRMLDASLVDDNKRKYIDAQLAYHKKNRQAVIEDILYYIDKAKGLINWDSPHLVCEELGLDVVGYRKSQEWSSAMSVILHQIWPDVTHFDFGINDEDRKLDHATSALEEVIEDLLSVGTDGAFIVDKDMMLEHYLIIHGETNAAKSKYTLSRHIKKFSKNLHRFRIEDFRNRDKRGWLIWDDDKFPKTTPMDKLEKIYWYQDRHLLHRGEPDFINTKIKNNDESSRKAIVQNIFGDV